MPFAATWMDLEIIILSEVKTERQISYDITYMWNLKKDTNELIYKIEIDSQTQKTNLWLTKGKRGEGKIRSLGLTYINIIYKIDKQQEPIVKHKELYSISCNIIMENSLKKNIYI